MSSKIISYMGHEAYQDHDAWTIYKDGQYVGRASTRIAVMLRIKRLSGENETKFLGRPITLINTPTHQRWWLPNRDYWYEIRIVDTPRGKVARHRIVHNETRRVHSFDVGGKVFEKWDIPLGHPMYDRLTMYAQELAEKQFRRPSPKKWDGTKKKTTLFYNVVNVKEPKKALMEDVAFLHLAQQFKAVQVVRNPKETFEIVEIEKED